jgi:hypothetical protein
VLIHEKVLEVLQRVADEPVGLVAPLLFPLLLVLCSIFLTPAPVRVELPDHARLDLLQGWPTHHRLIIRDVLCGVPNYALKVSVSLPFEALVRPALSIPGGFENPQHQCFV